MQQNRKLCAWYFLIVMTLLLFCSIIFMIMNKIESTTTSLEAHVNNRNMKYIVDDEYMLRKEKHKNGEVEFLRELTDFFSSFHDQTIEMKKDLDVFLARKRHIDYRFSQAKVKLYDLTVVPDSGDIAYLLKHHLVTTLHNRKRFIKQIPFSKQLKFRKKDARHMANSMYFVCTARLAVSSEHRGNFYLGIVSSEEKQDVQELVPYKIVKKKDNLMLNKILVVRDPKDFTIAIKGFTTQPITLHRMEASCMSFHDVGDEDVNKIK